MKTKFFLLLIIAVFTCNFTNAQTSVNDYKYVVVPSTFDFLGEPDKYRLNTLTKLLFEKYGYSAIMEDEKLPDDAISNNCLALKANVLRESGAFNSKLKVQLKNCKNEVVFTSNIGKSKDKKYQVAYTLALREAFKSFEVLKYQYKENEAILSYGNKASTESTSEIKKLQEEIKILKEEKAAVIKQPKELKEIVVKEVVVKEVIHEESKVQNTESLDVLYAQKITNGFQLVDNKPQVIYTIKKTGMQNVFLVVDTNAIIYQLDANWIIEYYENEKLQTKILNIKF